MKQADANQDLKKAAGIRAASFVQSGMRVGLGTGSTAAFLIEELGRRKREENLQIVCTATSFSSQVLGEKAGLTVLPIDQFDDLDISIDGADEIDPRLYLIKGGGAAHTREKLVHAMSRRFVVIADSSKRVQKLGVKFAVPVEVIPCSARYAMRRLMALGATHCEIRMSKSGKDGPVVTDNGNFILDSTMDLADPISMETAINCIPGVLENGIFASVRPVQAVIAEAGGLDEITLPA